MFGRETMGQLGTCTPGFFHGPGLNNFEIAMLKDMRIAESKTVQSGFEFFNAFNPAQFNNPSGSINNSNFRGLTTARSPRVGQLALKFSEIEREEFKWIADSL